MFGNLIKTIIRRKIPFLVLIYGCIAGGSFFLAYEVRFDFLVPPEYQQDRLHFIGAMVALKLVLLILARQTGSMLTFFSVPDLIRLAWAVGLTAILLFIPRLFGFPQLSPPRGVLLIDTILSFALLCGFRLAIRLYRERMFGGGKPGKGVLEQVIIVGAGDAGASLAKELVSHPRKGLQPVLFLDDDTGKHGKLIHGLPIAGLPEELASLTAATGVRRVIIAMPSAAHKRIREILLLLTGQGYKVEIMPALEELASGRVKVSQVRPVDIEDLLGREPVELDRASIRKFVENKVVLVTGAGGSIGSELCRQIADQNPQRLLMVDQSEASLFVIEQEMNERGMGALCESLVADVLDEARLTHIFGRHRPQVVFHAAAHKHVYLMERQPMEAIRNNSVGTRTVARIAMDHDVETFVMISTDKAINPTNVMGASKRLAELHLQAMLANRSAQDGEGPARKKPRTHYMAVRFGNVLGSSGSVVPIFRRQIEKGGPVTVTHPEVTRYFMTIPEAVGLVMQAAVLGTSTENGGGFSIFVLDMGNPVKIVDLARQMIELSGFVVGEDIEIKFTGLKRGEKLFEELQHKTEDYVPTAHPRIMRFVPKQMDIAASERAILDLESRRYAVDNNEVKRALRDIIPEYTPHWE